jgi:hypothetical protein
MNRIEQRFAALKAAGQRGLVVYIGAGDPNLEATRRLALSFDAAGVDVLELGVPFSDPLADGIVNQLAAQRGLESGTTPPKVLATITEIRTESQIPIVLYIYFNLLHRVGVERFIRDAAAAGVDGLLVLDLPPGTGDAQLTIAQRVKLAGAVIVSTPQDLALIDARRGVKMFERTAVPVLGIVENMSYFENPETGKPIAVFGTGGGARLAAETNLPLIGQVPLDPRIQEGGDTVRPIVDAEPTSRAAKELEAIATRVVERLVSIYGN